jgi:hypothetical protein
VTLTLTAGPSQGHKFVFDDRTTCIIGRDDDCRPRFPKDKEHQTIGRHHCLLDINPPDIVVRDLGSRNGTFVNGQLIGQRPIDMDAERGRHLRFAERALHDGDELRLGRGRAAVFRVSIHVPVVCIACGTVIAPDRTTAIQEAPGVYRCERCRHKPTAAPGRFRTCVQCGRDVADQPGANRPGDYLCTVCRTPENVGHQFTAAARTSGVPALRGYQVLDKLGQGGMGAVWLARHEESGRLVALKTMLPRVAADDRAVRRFLAEMSNSRLLKQGNIVRLEDTGYARGVFFMVLEYCDGGSVAALLKQRGGTLPVDEAVSIALQALDGLAYAHNAFAPGRGVVHRDLKPANLLLAGAGSTRVVKVADFGLSKAFDEAGLSGGTRTGETAGTPFFMPRQQVVNFKYAGPDVDVWALAASLYKMLTGHIPRDFAGGRDPWLTILETDPIPIRRRSPSVPKRLAEVIDHALRDTPEIGFPTAAAFKEALEGVF